MGKLIGCSADEELQRRRSKFAVVLDRVYATFGLPEPGERVTESVWAQVKGIPVDAWDYVADCVCGLDKKPANLGKQMNHFCEQWREHQTRKRTVFPQGGGIPAPPRSVVGDRFVELRRRNPGLSPVTALGMALESSGVRRGY